MVLDGNSDDESLGPFSHEVLQQPQKVLVSQMCFFLEIHHLHLHGWLPSLVFDLIYNFDWLPTYY